MVEVSQDLIRHDLDISDVEFAKLMDDHFSKTQIDMVGKVVHAVVKEVNHRKGYILVDAGLKSECAIPIKEFFRRGDMDGVEVGEVIRVYLTSLDAWDKCTVLSKEKAIREDSWLKLVEAYKNEEPVEGLIFAKTRSGLAVDIDAVICFLPGSQVSGQVMSDESSLIGRREKMMIIHLDENKRNVVVSRKAIRDAASKEVREQFLTSIKEGDIVEGYVKNLTSYGAFINLGDVIDGLLHVTDISWERVGHPAEVLNVGQKVKVKIIKFSKDDEKIAVGMKQLENNPWSEVETKYKVGSVVKGKITNIMNYGLFVQLLDSGESGIEGLVHLSEITWSGDSLRYMKENYSVGQEIEVQILDVNVDKHRLSLGIKQLLGNPWQGFIEKHNPGDILEGEIRNIAEFGLFVRVGEMIDGLVHIHDLAWGGDGTASLKKYKIGDKVQVMYVDSDQAAQKIRLGIKQLTADPMASSAISIGSLLDCKIVSKQQDGILVDFMGGMTSLIKKPNLGIDSVDEKLSTLNVGDVVRAKVISYIEATRRISLSIKAYEEDMLNSANDGKSSMTTLGDVWN